MASKRTVNKLSDSVIRAAESQEKIYCLSDGGNLFLEITKAGTKSWRYNYRFNGKSKTCRFGKYPLVGLADVRERRRLATDQIANGKDPALVKKLEKNTLEADTFEEVACDWMDTNQVNWSPSHATRTASYLKRDVYPIIGQMGLKAIEVKHIILIIRNVAGCGAVARRLKGVKGGDCTGF